MARIMGIDFGTKRVGIALSDKAGHFAFPHTILENTNTLVRDIAILVNEQHVSEVVIGESKNFSGGDNAIVPEARLFAEMLHKAANVSIVWISEVLTTAHAKRQFERSEKTREQKPTHALDASAAALILEQYLQLRRAAAPSPMDNIVSSVSDPKKISIDDFHAVEIKIGEIINAELIEGADKLLKLTVDVGEVVPRQILSGIRRYFPNPQVLIGKRCPFVTNLAPRVMRGLESNGMILAVSTNDAFSLLEVPLSIPPGTPLK